MGGGEGDTIYGCNGLLKDLGKLTVSIIDFWEDLTDSEEMTSLLKVLGVDGNNTENNVNFGRLCQLGEMLSDLKQLHEGFSYEDFIEGLVGKIGADGNLHRSKRQRAD